jgi:6-phosphofructokinase 1
MDRNMKVLGVLTSGGDSQGMNAAVRAVVRTARAQGMKVMGIHDGYKGLIEGHVEELTETSVSDLLAKGGTFLRTARCLEFKEEAGVLAAVESCKKLGIEGIVAIGGDGSFRGARDLCLHGIKCVGIPGTIDNDIACSEYTIGFDTCLSVCVDCIDRLRDTAASHSRCSVVEVMGRNAGWVALESGIMGGATAILVPEVEFDLQKDVIDRIEKAKALGKNSFIVVVSEGIFANEKSNKNYEYVVKNNIANADALAKAIEAATGVTSRGTVLGHIQRGGVPTGKDRAIASEMGHYAVSKLLANDIYNRVVAVKDGKVTDIDILEGLNMKKPFDVARYEMANTVNL